MQRRERERDVTTRVPGRHDDSPVIWVSPDGLDHLTNQTTELGIITLPCTTNTTHTEILVV